MNKLFIRVIALLLVPCLITDPVSAAAFHLPITVSFSSSRQLNEQALAPSGLAEREHHPLLERVPIFGRLLKKLSPAGRPSSPGSPVLLPEETRGRATAPERRTDRWWRAYVALLRDVAVFSFFPSESHLKRIAEKRLPVLARFSLGRWDAEAFHASHQKTLEEWFGFDKGLLLLKDYDPTTKKFVKLPRPKLIRDNSILIREKKYGIQMKEWEDYRQAASQKELLTAFRRKFWEESRELAGALNNQNEFFRKQANLLDAMQRRAA